MSKENIILRDLSIEEAADVHERHMHRDFPPDELKPFSMIREGILAGNYACLGAYEKDRLAGYAFLVYGPDMAGERHVLLDYLAVLPEDRGKGYGSRILSLLRERLNDKGDILIEIEDPDFAADPEEAKLMLGRQEFYLQSNVYLSGVRSTVYGVHYRIMVLPSDIRREDAAIEEEISGIYHSLFPKEWWSDGRAAVRNTGAD